MHEKRPENGCSTLIPFIIVLYAVLKENTLAKKNIQNENERKFFGNFLHGLLILYLINCISSKVSRHHYNLHIFHSLKQKVGVLWVFCWVSSIVIIMYLRKNIYKLALFFTSVFGSL